jgi:hypothetical protein
VKKLIVTLCVISLTAANTITIEHQEDTGNKKRRRESTQGTETTCCLKKTKLDELASEATSDLDRTADDQSYWDLLPVELKAQVISSLVSKTTFKEFFRYAFVNKEFSSLVLRRLAKIKQLAPSDPFLKVTLELLLLRASVAANIACIRDLLELGTNVNARDENDSSALIIASRYGHSKIVQLLLAHRANLNIVDASGKTAFGWALQNGHTDIVDLLRAYSLKKKKNRDALANCRTWASDNGYGEIADKINTAFNS